METPSEKRVFESERERLVDARSAFSLQPHNGIHQAGESRTKAVICHPTSPTTPCSFRGDRGQATVEFVMTSGLVGFLVADDNKERK